MEAIVKFMDLDREARNGDLVMTKAHGLWEFLDETGKGSAPMPYWANKKTCWPVSVVAVTENIDNMQEWADEGKKEKGMVIINNLYVDPKSPDKAYRILGEIPHAAIDIKENSKILGDIVTIRDDSIIEVKLRDSEGNHTYTCHYVPHPAFTGYQRIKYIFNTH